MNAYKKIIKNMNGLYLTVYDTNDTSSGVCKKIKSQVKVFEENGINIDIIDSNSISVIKNSYMVDAFYAILGKNNIRYQRKNNFSSYYKCNYPIIKDFHIFL